jgi:hypothetical protein
MSSKAVRPHASISNLGREKSRDPMRSLDGDVIGGRDTKCAAQNRVHGVPRSRADLVIQARARLG